MSADSKFALAFARLVTAINNLDNRLGLQVGTLTNLETADKTDIVKALNELKAKIDNVQAQAQSGATINDKATNATATWSSTKIQAQITKAITDLIGGSDTANDTLKELADQITALAQADNGLVSASKAQNFTPEQKRQACANLGLPAFDYDYVSAINTGLNAGL